MVDKELLLLSVTGEGSLLLLGTIYALQVQSNCNLQCLQNPSIYNTANSGTLVIINLALLVVEMLLQSYLEYMNHVCSALPRAYCN